MNMFFFDGDPKIHFNQYDFRTFIVYELIYGLGFFNAYTVHNIMIIMPLYPFIINLKIIVLIMFLMEVLKMVNS